jgi:hypothetical protein
MGSPRVDRTPTGVEPWLARGRALRAPDAPALARRAADLGAAAAPLTPAGRGTLAAPPDQLGRDAETTPDRLERRA